MELSEGQVFGDYEILGILGAGGMGKVYKVRNKISNRVEAMKILLSSLTAQPELVDRFTREIRIFGSLDHPNIAELRTALRVEDQLVMIMEFVDGSSLDGLMKQGRVPKENYIGYMCQALSALSYAHAKGVVHRDIKPANMMVTPTGVLKLMDFGIAKAVSDPQLTKTGFMVGSVFYVSPEQIEGKNLDGRSDLYSLGISLYELATGKRPFDGNSDYQIISAHMKENPPAPCLLEPTLPAELSDIILLALARDPAERFQTADAMKNALSSLIGKPATAQARFQDNAPPPAIPAKRNMRLPYMLAGSAATLAVIVAAVIELPKMLHTSAATKLDVAVSAPAPRASTPERLETPAPIIPAPIIPAPIIPAPIIPAAAQAREEAPKPAPKSVAAAPSKPAPVALPVRQETPIPPPQAQSVAPHPAPPPQSAAPLNSAAVEELRERANLMSVRVSTVRASFQSLQKQQAAAGLSPRSDMVAADQRLGYQLDQAEAGLQQGDVPAAKKRLDAAERDLEKLESFLGK
jgi:eukaryotic-like serine/threonine-protein kinase